MKVSEIMNATVYCKLAPSPIHGVGVFAIRDIPQGTEFSPDNEAVYKCDDDDFGNILPEIKELIIQRNSFIEGQPLIFINPNKTQIFQQYMNHSNTPNSDGRFAIRDILKDEEITEDFTLVSPPPMHTITKERNSQLK